MCICISVIIMSLMQMTRDYVELHQWGLKEVEPAAIQSCYPGIEKPYAFCTKGKARKFLPDNSEMWEDL